MSTNYKVAANKAASHFACCLVIIVSVVFLAGCPAPSSQKVDAPSIAAEANIASLTRGTPIAEGGIILARQSGGGTATACDVAGDSPDQLPTGTMLSVNGEGHCVLSGTPTGTSKTYSLKLLARNSGGASEAITVSVTVNPFAISIEAQKDGSTDVLPVVSSFPSATAGEVINLVATVPDGASGTWTQSGTDSATIRVANAPSTAVTLPASLSAGSAYTDITFTLVATHNGVEARASISIRVYLAPTASITAPTDGASAGEGSNLTLSGTATGGTAAWTVSGTNATAVANTNIADATALSTTATLPVVTADTMLTFTLTTTSPVGTTATATATVTVQDIISITASASTGVEGTDAITLTGMATGTSPTYTWSTSSGASFATPSAASTKITLPYLELATLNEASQSITITLTATTAEGTETTNQDLTVTPRMADSNNNGLIEVNNLHDLHFMRYSLNGSLFKTSASDAGRNTGCPQVGGTPTCTGYELTGNLSFDVDGQDDGTWTVDTTDPDNPVYTLDAGDTNSAYFNTNSGGWLPIGDDDNRFTAIFEGNGHSISWLAVQRNQDFVGLFGHAERAQIRRVHLLNYSSAITSTSTLSPTVGSLVGRLTTGTIIASSASGNIFSFVSQNATFGGIVGRLLGSNIIASRSAIEVNTAGGNEIIGGLVGQQSINAGGSSLILASYASGDINANAGNDYIGGLVGNPLEGSIVASYASGSLNGGGDNDRVGGLTGWSNSPTIVSSYATGNTDGGTGTDDVGALTGRQISTTTTASFGFGTTSNGSTTSGTAGTAITNATWTALMADARIPSALTLAIVNDPDGDSGTTNDNKWNSASDLTAGAWNFTMKATANGGGPALNYADYDGTGNAYYCTGETKPTTGTPIEIPNCGMLIPGQRN